MPVFRLNDDIIFPRPSLAEANGLLAVGGDLRPGRLICAYRQGIFPWYSEGDPILWWFTSPRLVIIPDEFSVPKRLARYMRNCPYTISRDRAFDQVIDQCARVRTDQGEETWITDEMKSAYCLLHRLGYAHSVECWLDDRLIGGLYGVALGRVFFGESMFTTRSNASKMALVALVTYLKEKKYGLVDCQMTTEHLLQYGAKEIGGRTFRKRLDELIDNITPDGTWNDESETR